MVKLDGTTSRKQMGGLNPNREIQIRANSALSTFNAKAGEQPRVGELVHQQVDPKKNEVVRPNPERYLAGQADSRRRVSGQAGALLQGQEDKDGAQIQRK